LEKLPDLTVGKIGSPCELRIYDSQGKITGVVEGQVREEIPNSVYFNDTFILLSSTDTYTYEVRGLDEGTYNLLIAHSTQNKITIFRATDIPISINEIHQFILNWGILSENQQGATVKVDLDGDSRFEKTFTSDKELTRDEFISQIRRAENLQLWIIGVAITAIAVVTAIVILQRRRKQTSKVIRQN
jgi:hypothetical protein